jgi:hypothetical protein
MAGLREPTFAEREGAKALPAQLQLRVVSDEIRAKVWGLIFSSLEGSKYYDRTIHTNRLRNWEKVLKSAWTTLDHKFADEFDPHPTKAIPYAKSKMRLNYTSFLEFVEFLVKHPNFPQHLIDALNSVFVESGFAYRIINKTIVPISNEQMAQAVTTAMTDLGTEHLGAEAHLAAAASNLTKGQYADSIRESIHAVESVARRINPEASTLAPALTDFEKKHRLHPALRKAFLSLYGYTSDEEGIRHALINENQSKVTESEALYMLGSCASFATFLATLAKG